MRTRCVSTVDSHIANGFRFLAGGLIANDPARNGGTNQSGFELANDDASVVRTWVLRRKTIEVPQNSGFSLASPRLQTPREPLSIHKFQFRCAPNLASFDTNQQPLFRVSTMVDYPTMSVPLTDIVEPSKNDVLSGRGVTTNRFPGNMSYRSLVALNKVSLENGVSLDGRTWKILIQRALGHPSRRQDALRGDTQQNDGRTVNGAPFSRATSPCRHPGATDTRIPFHYGDFSTPRNLKGFSASFSRLRSCLTDGSKGRWMKQK